MHSVGARAGAEGSGVDAGGHDAYKSHAKSLREISGRAVKATKLSRDTLEALQSQVPANDGTPPFLNDFNRARPIRLWKSLA
jgi:hypothetical protein